MNKRYDCIIVGGGVIGLSIAWRTAQLGLSTLVCEAGARPQGASWAAAGMLAPVTEATYGEEALLDLNLKSARLYPQFLSELSDCRQTDIRPNGDGTLYAALDRDQSEALSRLYVFHRSLGLSAEWLDASACRELEPALHPRTRAAVLAPGDLAVDPRDLLEALAAAVVKADGEVHLDSPVSALHGGRNPGVTLSTGDRVSCGTVVLSAGCWSGSVSGAPPELREAVRPVKGQILRLRSVPANPPLVKHTVRTEDVYMVPRRGGGIVVGASVEEKGYDTTLTAGVVMDLLRAADEAVPGIRELELVEASAGLRPGTPDNAPMLGPTSIKGLIAATGHYRNGVLLAPITASAIAALIVKGEVPEEIANFHCGRFS